MREILNQGLAQLGVEPPDGAVDILCRYGQLLLKQNEVMNLTAITQPEEVVKLHFLDSASVAVWAGSGWLAGKRVLDVGTGAGLPGMVLKALEPSISLTLLDSLGKRVHWLEEICKGLFPDEVICLHARAEEQGWQPGFRDSFDVVTSRAVASFPLLCELCLPFVKVGGVFLAMKSVESTPEVQAGEQGVKRLGGKLLPEFDYQVPGTRVVHRLVPVEKCAPTSKGYPRKWAKIKKEPL